MAVANEVAGSGQVKRTPQQSLEAARAARSKRANSDIVLDQDERFGLQLARNAKKACTLLATRIQNRQPVSAEALKACGTLSGIAAELMVE